MQRLRELLHDLADTQGVLRGWSARKLTQEFNTRYNGVTKPVNHATVRTYLQQARAEGWATSQPDPSHPTRLIWILAPDEQAGTTGGVA